MSSNECHSISFAVLQLSAAYAKTGNTMELTILSLDVKGVISDVQIL